MKLVFKKTMLEKIEELYFANFKDLHKVDYLELTQKEWDKLKAELYSPYSVVVNSEIPEGMSGQVLGLYIKVVDNV